MQLQVKQNRIKRANLIGDKFVYKHLGRTN